MTKTTARRLAAFFLVALLVVIGTFAAYSAPAYYQPVPLATLKSWNAATANSIQHAFITNFSPGGAGQNFDWNANSTKTANNCNVIAAFDAPGTGRWELNAPRGSFSTMLCPFVWDNFNRSNRLLNGDATPSGQTWTLLGAGASAASITDNKFVASDNVYAYLPKTVGASTVTDVAAVFTLALPSGTYDPNNAAVTLIADQAQSLSDVDHLLITPNQWLLTVRNGGGSFNALCGGQLNLQTDGHTRYGARMHIDPSGFILVTPPNGAVTRCPAVGTDSRITAVNPQNGAFQIHDGTSFPTAAVAAYRYVSVNESAPLSDVVRAAGVGAGAEDVWWLTGFGPTYRQRTTYVIPAANTNHLYTFETGSSSTLLGFNIQGNVKITATTSALWQIANVDASGMAVGTPTLSNATTSGTGSLVDSCTLSNNGSSAVQLDCHVPTNANDVTVTVETFGVMVPTPYTNLTPSTPLSNASASVIFSAPQPATNLTLSGASGWYTLYTASTDWTGNGLAINGSLNVRIPGAGANGYQNIVASCSATGANLQTGPLSYIFSNQAITQYRESYDAGHTQCQFDGFKSTASDVTVTGTPSGTYTINPTPAVGATVLSGGNVVVNADGTNATPLTALAQIAANSLVGNATGSTGNVGAVSMPSCSVLNSFLQYTLGSGFSCTAASGATWNISLANTQSIPASPTVVAFDTAASTGNSAAGGCDTTTNKGRCTPTLAGVWDITCQLEITASAAIPANNDIGYVDLRFNGSSTYAAADSIAQVLTGTVVTTVVSTRALKAFNGSTDFTECRGSTDSTTGGNVIQSSTRTRFIGAWQHS